MRIERLKGAKYGDFRWSFEISMGGYVLHVMNGGCNGMGKSSGGGEVKGV